MEKTTVCVFVCGQEGIKVGLKEIVLGLAWKSLNIFDPHGLHSKLFYSLPETLKLNTLNIYFILCLYFNYLMFNCLMLMSFRRSLG